MDRYIVIEESTFNDLQAALNSAADKGYRVVSPVESGTFHTFIMELTDKEDAKKLLKRACDLLDESDTSADRVFWRDYYAYTGQHMIQTDEGWAPGAERITYDDADILCEVNGPR